MFGQGMGGDLRALMGAQGPMPQPNFGGPPSQFQPQGGGFGGLMERLQSPEFAEALGGMPGQQQGQHPQQPSAPPPMPAFNPAVIQLAMQMMQQQAQRPGGAMGGPMANPGMQRFMPPGAR